MDLKSPDYRPLLIDGLEQDKTYRVILTNGAGLLQTDDLVFKLGRRVYWLFVVHTIILDIFISNNKAKFEI